MDKASEAILALKPVTSATKRRSIQMASQFGLVAEEVEKVNPDLITRDEEGTTAVRYEAVNAMLLNEFLKEHRKVAEQQAMIDQLKSTVAKQEAAIGQQGKAMELLAAHVKEQDSRTRVFQTQLSKARSQMVVNNRPAD